MLLNFKDMVLLNLDGTPLVEKDKETNKELPAPKLASVLASVLINLTKSDPIKWYDYATTLTKEESIELDESDLKKIEELVEKSEQIPVLVKAQLLKSLYSVRANKTE